MSEAHGSRGLDLRPGQPWVPGWFWGDHHVHQWPLAIRHAFLWAYSRADWKTGYWQIDTPGLKGYAGLDCEPSLAVQCWVQSGLVVAVRPGLLRFATWIEDQHRGVKDWTDWKGVKVFALLSDVEGVEVAKALLPGRHPAPLLTQGEADPTGAGVGEGSPLPPPQDRKGGVEVFKGLELKGWSDVEAQGWAHAVLPGVGLLVLKPAPWTYQALALLLTRLGKDRVKVAAAAAAKSDQVGGFDAFLRQVNRFVPVDVVKVCKHDRVRPGETCRGCQEAPGAPMLPQEPATTSTPSLTTSDQAGEIRLPGETYQEAIKRLAANGA